MRSIHDIRRALHDMGYPTIRDGTHYYVFGLALYPSNRLCAFGLQRLWEGLAKVRNQ